MNYRNNNGNNDLSILGFGCMRFKKKGTGFDMEEVEREILYAVENGVNYFDTAFIYSGSEEALGTVVQKNNLRDKIKIATKLPHYLMKTREDMEKNFAEQLKRLRTDYVDFYLMHMLPDKTAWEELCKRGALEWLTELKKEGKIRNLGFSYHGNTSRFIELLNAYDWDFCQIQYNYMDENSQAGRKGLLAAAEKGIPVIIMEPLRGGRLVNDLPKDAIAAFTESARGYSSAEWALRWLWDQKEVSVVLSGMNSMEMLKENIRIASEVSPGEFTEGDKAVIEKVRRAFDAMEKIPCTGCSYCMPCPFGVDIPGDAVEQRHAMWAAENLADLGREGKLAVLAKCRPGDLIFSEGHVMLYLGQDDKGEPYVIHASSSKWFPGEGDDGALKYYTRRVTVDDLWWHSGRNGRCIDGLILAGGMNLQ